MRIALSIVLLLSVSPKSFAAAAKQIKVHPSASYVHDNDGGHGGKPLAAFCDGKEPKDSNDHAIPRFTFWSHKGTAEWVQLDFDGPTEISGVEIYWFDDRPGGGCRIPASWRLLYRTGYSWMPVGKTSDFGVARDQYNKVAFKPVMASALRIDVQLQPGFSGGILECKINGDKLKLGRLGAIGPQDEADVDFDYPRTRLALAALIPVLADEEKAKAEVELTKLDDAMGTYLAARAKAGFGDTAALAELRQAGETLASTGEQYGPKSTLPRLDQLDADRCLQLMIRLDWIDQDVAKVPARGFLPLASMVIDQLGADAAELIPQHEKMLEATVAPDDIRWMELYLQACDRRRAVRMGSHLAQLETIVFTKHHDIGGQHYAYTEDISDSPYNDNNPFPNSGKLCLLEMEGLYGKVRTLVDEPDGLVRDPDVSFDGRRILFARRTSMTEDDYHLYEINMDDGQMRQLTSGQGVADYEPAYLPNGDIIFNSSRCQQIVDCWWADVSNLYTCDGDGRFLRRLSFDQVHTNYPQVMPDGRVIYTRWDYNDRGQLFPQPLFVMNPDGTAQTEFYGNNSWFPTTILHGRGIPGTQKVLCVLSGHHTYQKGKLAIIDPILGRQENSGVQLIAPIRHTAAVKVDKYGHQGEQFQYPFPLSETEFLVTFSTMGSKQGRAKSEKPFGVYFMTIDGQRELLAADPKISCNQAIPLAPRRKPRVRPSRVDYRKTTGTYFLQDIYQGPGLAGIARGTVKRLRVVALDFRAAGVGSNGNRGPAGGALVSTPISINGAWDVKRVLGSAKVYEDGSAAFTVPARTPVYFQALDENNHVVQTMRSWSTLQPNETYSCIGCHEEKNSTPPTRPVVTQAMQTGPKRLESFYGSSEGFSFPRVVQPILDRRCVSCHSRKAMAAKKSTISLEGAATEDRGSAKAWSDGYKTLANRKYTDWVSPQSGPPMLAPYQNGAAKSPLIKLLSEDHEGVKLTQEELDKIACWIDLAVPSFGDYTEGMNPANVAKYEKYLNKRRHWAAEEADAIQALLDATP